jgi:hypothetical protein
VLDGVAAMGDPTKQGTSRDLRARRSRNRSHNLIVRQRVAVEGRDHWSGDNFIRIGGLDDNEPDMYVMRDTTPATTTDLDFIAHARQDVPRLLAEVRRLRESEDLP